MIKVINKALDILEYVSQKEKSCTLSEIALAIGEKPTTVSNIVQTLLKRDYLERGENGGYRLGIEAYILTGSTPNYNSILYEVSEEPLRELVKTVQADGVIGVFKGDKKYTILRIRCDSLISVSSSVYDNKNPCATETGLILLAHQEPKIIERVISENEATSIFKGKEELIQAMEKIKTDGYCISFFHDELRAVAAPLFCNGKVVAAIGLYQPRLNQSPETETLLKNSILETSKNISKKLSERIKHNE